MEGETPRISFPVFKYPRSHFISIQLDESTSFLDVFSEFPSLREEKPWQFLKIAVKYFSI